MRSRPAAALLLALVALTTSGATPSAGATARSAPTRVPGIDVSRWQEDVDWTDVAGSSVRFVIMKATQGVAQVDKKYGVNLAAASSSGLVVGAYHVATVSAVPGDAVAEADHFLDVARNAAADIVPVLDIEHDNGLTPAQLQDWVRDWVQRVRSKLGVRPMIYASPGFWRYRMGDTVWFANHGYPLWIANWNVAQPDVPANDWGGHGWTFWQWTNTGSIPGITTDVDRDRYVGSDLANAVVAQLSVTPTAGGEVTGARIACGDAGTQCTRLANPADEVTLTATPDDGAVFLRWTGACKGIGPVCTLPLLGSMETSAIFGWPVDVSVTGTGAGTVTSSPGGLECSDTCSTWLAAGRSITLTATPDSASGFGSWGDACTGSSPDCVLTLSGPASVTARFDAAVELEEDAARYAWGSVTDTRAIGGSYLAERRAGASSTFAFTGSKVTLYTVAGRAFGQAEISIDGSPVETMDGAASSFRTKIPHAFSGLGAGPHELTVTVLGEGAQGTRVGLDALRFGGALVRNPRPETATWATFHLPARTYAVSDIAGASATLRFTGTGVTLNTVRGPWMGRARVWVDGSLVGTWDLYAPETVYDATRTLSGLDDGHHVLRLVVLGERRSAAAGSSIAVDGWIVR